MLWSVHDHPDGRNRARARAHGAVRSVAADSMSTAIAPVASRSDALVAADDVVGAGERAGVHGAPGHGACQFLDEQFGARARRGAVRVPGLVGDDQVPRVHAGGEPGAEAGGEDGRPAQRRVARGPGRRPARRPWVPCRYAAR